MRAKDEAKFLAEAYNTVNNGIILERIVGGKLMCPEACCGAPVMECKCAPDCPHCNCFMIQKAVKKYGLKDKRLQTAEEDEEVIAEIAPFLAAAGAAAGGIARGLLGAGLAAGRAAGTAARAGGAVGRGVAKAGTIPQRAQVRSSLTDQPDDDLEDEEGKRFRLVGVGGESGQIEIGEGEFDTVDEVIDHIEPQYLRGNKNNPAYQNRLKVISKLRKEIKNPKNWSSEGFEDNLLRFGIGEIYEVVDTGSVEDNELHLRGTNFAAEPPPVDEEVEDQEQVRIGNTTNDRFKRLRP